MFDSLRLWLADQLDPTKPATKVVEPEPAIVEIPERLYAAWTDADLVITCMLAGYTGDIPTIEVNALVTPRTAFFDASDIRACLQSACVQLTGMDLDGEPEHG